MQMVHAPDLARPREVLTRLERARIARLKPQGASAPRENRVTIERIVTAGNRGQGLHDPATRKDDRFAEIAQQSYEILGHEGATSVKPTMNGLDELTLGPDGYFCVILSAERPVGHDGDWWRLAPTTVRLLLRQCSVDWIQDIDARVAIERLDEGPETSVAEIERRIGNLAAWAEGMVRFDIDLARWYREHHGVNVLTRSKKIESIGGLPNQVYYDGAYEIDDDEALIVETALPRQCHYWSLLVADDRFSADKTAGHQQAIDTGPRRCRNPH